MGREVQSHDGELRAHAFEEEEGEMFPKVRRAFKKDELVLPAEEPTGA